MSAGSQDHVARAIGDLTGTDRFPGATPVALTPDSEWKLGKAWGYTALQLPPRAARGVLALLTTGAGRCTAVVMTPARVFCRVRFPTVPMTYFKGTVLDGYMTDETFHVTDVIACRGSRTCSLDHPDRMEVAWQLVRDIVQSKQRSCSEDMSFVAPELDLTVPNGRDLRQLRDAGAGTHLLVPQCRTFAPGRVQADTFLVSFRGLGDMLDAVG